jgi:ribonuclease E
MSNKMLIDATHPEETRVVVLRGNRVEEFDFEAADRQQLRGNIYLAKVTRVEPSLQAAFVDYGGNRHGFLAFSEIHPDYYQIPFADRQALIQAQAEEQAEEEAEERAAEEAEEAAAGAEAPPALAEAFSRPAADEVSEPAATYDRAEAPDAAESTAPDSEPASNLEDQASADATPTEPAEAEVSEERSLSLEATGSADLQSDDDEVNQPRNATSSDTSAAEDIPGSAEGAQDDERPLPEAERHDEPPHDDTVESVGAVDALEEVPERRKPRPRQYKIQEVIKRRQVLLVQVVKEERGNKGAALTTYLSLAGRYSVLMPNTGRGGGISRKITNPADRKRLKSIAGELDVPEGMGVILRTAGANRTKAEVKRDFEYLLRLWENVRELTLRSTAPKLVYEEGSLIKRSIRDLYSREVEQVVVAGEDAYREAKDFMRMLMPSHARNVQLYRDDTPIFSRSGVEAQLDAMFSPQVTLKSGGYIVINQTEALVSIDVNSGRSTREHNIEDTALNTNLEAAEEIARQLRLRDLAGLIVIDFIDMEENRNNRAVERKMKDCLRFDRARIQVGRISHFGLMEMSRQRLRTGVLESSVVACPHCRGTGQVRSISSLSLQILRAIEDQLLRNAGHHLYVRTRPDVALYVLNQKRRHLAELEERFGLTVTVTGEAPENGAGFAVERGAPVEERPARPARAAPPMLIEPPEEEEDSFEAEADEVDETEAPTPESEAGEGRDKRRRRRRRRGGEDRGERSALQEGEMIEAGEEGEQEAEAGPDTEARSDEAESDQESRRRRRGRRGGRRRGRNRENGDAGLGATEEGFVSESAPGDFTSDEAFGPGDPGAEEGERLAEPPSGSDDDLGQDGQADPMMRENLAQAGDAAFPAAVDSQVAGVFGREDIGTDPAGDGHADEVEALTGAVQEAPADESETAPAPQAVEKEQSPPPAENSGPKRSGWWNRRSFF